ncbi:GntR family transcriptional regulator [Variovorax sp. PBL-E5]|uniref:GntR family transcriptional regulator n=1 Tax=Variovorax sp. PBL-E5 TaxID=434014 RepID=UPI001315ECE3|nr:GntR family transcriptional regulator [Variovorax sp. PBL-E5]VTU34430.1 HTH-type transcriptional repressor YvoA [Variovorax sp. PBL-E5]
MTLQLNFLMTSHRPLYQTLASVLEREIQEGKWKPGDRLPTEVELMELHGMGRVTVRHALDLLRGKNMIERFPQRGSVVLDPSLVVGMRSLDTISDVVRLGMETETEAVSWGLVDAPESAAVFFGKGQDKVYRLHGTRQKLGVTVYAVTSYIREELGARISEVDLSSHTPLELIRNLNVPVVRGDEEIWAESADAQIADELHIPAGSTVIIEQRRLYGRGSLPIVLATTWWRTDQYRRISKITH